eukprot:3846133-Rhodomonas_salina.1
MQYKTLIPVQTHTKKQEHAPGQYSPTILLCDILLRQCYARCGTDLACATTTDLAQCGTDDSSIQ